MEGAPTDDLTGAWRAAVADEELRRAFADPAFDDTEWESVQVPGHWRSTPAFAAEDGPVLHRRRFATPPAGASLGSPAGHPARDWLILEGVFYQGDVWLDGAYLGDTEGYFVPHAFEVTASMAAASEHVLAVEVACAPQHDRTAKRNITGVFQHWDCLDPAWNPGGIWRPVRLERTGPVRIRSLRVLCAEVDDERALVSFRAVLDSDAHRRVTLRTAVGEVDHDAEHRLAVGENTVEWRVRVERPRLWWPHSLGDQPLYDVLVDVELPDEGGVVSHRASRRTGLRRLAWRRWTLTVNGERLFLKGSNQGPAAMQLADADPALLAGDVALAKEANLDFLRLHAHITRPEVYDAADEAGLLLWQDFPLQWGYARGIRLQAVRQAAAAVDLLGHHPSVFLWCGHNEPVAIDIEPGVFDDPDAARRVMRHTAVAMELPSWNKDVLDRSVRRAFEHHDGSRPAIAHSGVWPGPTSTGTDSHLYFGWYWGDERDLPTFLARFPRMARFVGEFGAQSAPDTLDFLEPDRWPDLDWERLGRHHGLQRSILDRHVEPGEVPDAEEWVAATQRYQAELVKHHVEHLRRLKYRPTGGFAHFCFADGHPGITWSVLDHRRVPKLAYAALRDACAPVIVVADRPPGAMAPEEPLALDVHVVSDLRDPIHGATVTAGVVAPDGGVTATWAWRGDVAADACVRVGTVQLLAPDEPGVHHLELELHAGGRRLANRYDVRVISRP